LNTRDAVGRRVLRHDIDLVVAVRAQLGIEHEGKPLRTEGKLSWISDLGFHTEDRLMQIHIPVERHDPDRGLCGAGRSVSRKWSGLGQVQGAARRDHWITYEPWRQFHPDIAQLL